MAKNKKLQQSKPIPTPTRPNVKLGYRFDSLRVIEYRGNDASDIEGDSIQFNFNVKVGFGVSLTPPFIAIIPEITCSPLDQPEREICFLKLHTIFPVVGMESLAGKEEITFPPEFMANLINLAVGAARGVLFAKNFGTLYGQALMPPMNVQDLVPKEPFRIKTSDKQILIRT